MRELCTFLLICDFLAQRMRISENLAWNKSYCFTNVILPGLLHVGYSFVVFQRDASFISKWKLI